MNPTNTLYVRVLSHGVSRSGISAKGNPYIMGEAFAIVSDPNCPYPQKISYYCENEKAILKSGEWAVPVSYDVREGRLDFRLNTSEAIPSELVFKPVAKPTATTPTNQAKAS